MDYELLHSQALQYANDKTFKECGPMMLRYDVISDGQDIGTDVTPSDCGFAEIKSTSLNHPFIQYLLNIEFMKIANEPSIAYYWVRIYGQSHMHKKTFAREYVEYIKQNITYLNISYDSRLD